jgi:hydrogenase maturation protease
MGQATDEQRAGAAAIQIVALGSPHGDDRVAWQAAERLQSDARLARAVRKIASPWDLIDSLHSRSKVIVLDACCSGETAGTLVEFWGPDLEEYLDRGCSTHGGSISECLRLARALGRTCDDVVVLAVEIDQPAGVELSAAGREAVRKLEEGARQVLSRWHEID